MLLGLLRLESSTDANPALLRKQGVVYGEKGRMINVWFGFFFFLLGVSWLFRVINIIVTIPYEWYPVRDTILEIKEGYRVN